MSEMTRQRRSSQKEGPARERSRTRSPTSSRSLSSSRRRDPDYIPPKKARKESPPSESSSSSSTSKPAKARYASSGKKAKRSNKSTPKSESERSPSRMSSGSRRQSEDLRRVALQNQMRKLGALQQRSRSLPMPTPTRRSSTSGSESASLDWLRVASAPRSPGSFRVFEGLRPQTTANQLETVVELMAPYFVSTSHRIVHSPGEEYLEFVTQMMIFTCGLSANERAQLSWHMASKKTFIGGRRRSTSMTHKTGELVEHEATERRVLVCGSGVILQTIARIHRATDRIELVAKDQRSMAKICTTRLVETAGGQSVGSLAVFNEQSSTSSRQCYGVDETFTVSLSGNRVQIAAGTPGLEADDVKVLNKDENGVQVFECLQYDEQQKVISLKAKTVIDVNDEVFWRNRGGMLVEERRCYQELLGDNNNNNDSENTSNGSRATFEDSTNGASLDSFRPLTTSTPKNPPATFHSNSSNATSMQNSTPSKPGMTPKNARALADSSAQDSSAKKSTSSLRKRRQRTTVELTSSEVNAWNQSVNKVIADSYDDSQLESSQSSTPSPAPRGRAEQQRGWAAKSDGSITSTARTGSMSSSRSRSPLMPPKFDDTCQTPANTSTNSRKSSTSSSSTASARSPNETPAYPPARQRESLDGRSERSKKSSTSSKKTPTSPSSTKKTSSKGVGVSEDTVVTKETMIVTEVREKPGTVPVVNESTKVFQTIEKVPRQGSFRESVRLYDKKSSPENGVASTYASQRMDPLALDKCMPSISPSSSTSGPPVAAPRKVATTAVGAATTRTQVTQKSRGSETDVVVAVVETKQPATANTTTNSSLSHRTKSFGQKSTGSGAKSSASTDSSTTTCQIVEQTCIDLRTFDDKDALQKLFVKDLCLSCKVNGSRYVVKLQLQLKATSEPKFEPMKMELDGELLWQRGQDWQPSSNRQTSQTNTLAVQASDILKDKDHN